MRDNKTRSSKALRGNLGRGKPKSERLRSHLLDEIAAGALNPGDAIVAERHLAKVLKISRSTVRQTLDEMEREGLITRVQGRGTFVTEKAFPETANRSSAMAIVVLEVAAGYYVSLLSGFEDACAQAGYPVVVCNSGNSVDRQANHLMRLMAHRVSGVVLNASSVALTPPYQVGLLQNAGIPVVLLHRAIPEVSAPVLEMPVEEIYHRAAKLLIDAGHHNIAYIDSYRDDLSARAEASLQQTLNDAGLQLASENIVYGQSATWVSGTNFEEYDRFLDNLLPRLLSQPNRPTAIFAGFDSVAEHVYLAAQRLGLRIPADLSIVCFGGAHREGAILKRLSAVVIDEVTAGKRAVELLQEMRLGQRPIKDTQHFPLPLSYCEGETLGPP
jgi:GntR family transcriptional regulator, arabinose operon transcriptional repressor